VIEFELVKTNVLTRWPCTVCGGTTEKVSPLVEAIIEGGDGVSARLRVCEQCLKNEKIDEELQAHAQHLRRKADFLESLIGQLKVPTYAEWEAAYAAEEAECAKAYAEREAAYATSSKASSRGNPTGTDDLWPPF
jgi:hypothetical protein